jgi:hypothetical protein
MEFPTQGYMTLVQKLYRPVLLEKLARDWGIEPSTEGEVLQILDMAALLRQQKEAAEQTTSPHSFLGEAGDALKTLVGQNGPTPPTQKSEQIKEASVLALQDPEVRKAVEEFGSYLGQMIAG